MTVFHFNTEGDEFRKERPPTQWVGFVSLAAQTAIKIRMPDGSPLAPIIKVCLECILRCLDSSATDEELACAAAQVTTIWRRIMFY